MAFPPLSASNFGCIKERCREEAIAVQRIASWRLRLSKIRRATCCFDVAKAFGHVNRTATLETVSGVLPKFCQYMIEQPICGAKGTIAASDGECTFFHSRLWCVPGIYHWHNCVQLFVLHKAKSRGAQGWPARTQKKLSHRQLLDWPGSWGDFVC